MASHELFQSFWFGDTVFPHHWLCMKSFIDCGHAYRLYTYEPTAVPWGVERRDAREILPRERVFFYPRGPGVGSVAGFANLFRYKLLADNGGWWVDTDVVCRKKGAISGAEVIFAREQPHHVCNAVLKLPRGHALAWQLYTEAERAGTDLDWGATGPDLLTRLVDGSDYERYVLPNAFCYPILGVDGMAYLDPGECVDVERKAAESPLIHLWNEMWRRSGVDFFAPPAAGSFVAKLYEAHRLDFAQVVKIARFDQLAAEIEALGARLGDTESAQATITEESAESRMRFDREIDRLGATIDEARAASALLSRQLDEMARSTSWRITAPLRAIGRRRPELARSWRAMLRSIKPMSRAV